MVTQKLKYPMTFSRPGITMTQLANVIKILDLHILFSNLWFLSLLELCNFLPFFKAGVFVLFDSFRGCRVVLCSGHPDPVYFRYGSSSPTFDTDPPLRRDLTYFSRESSQLSNAQLFHSLLFTVSVKRCQKVFKKTLLVLRQPTPIPTGGRQQWHSSINRSRHAISSAIVQFHFNCIS